MKESIEEQSLLLGNGQTAEETEGESREWEWYVIKYLVNGEEDCTRKGWAKGSMKVMSSTLSPGVRKCAPAFGIVLNGYRGFESVANIMHRLSGLELQFHLPWTSR